MNNYEKNFVELINILIKLNNEQLAKLLKYSKELISN